MTSQASWAENNNFTQEIRFILSRVGFLLTQSDVPANHKTETVKPLAELMLRLETAVSFAAKDRLVRQFAEKQSSPIIESGRAVFYYISSDALTVALEGDWTGWKPTAQMSFLPDTPLWYRAEFFPNTARVEYRVVVNGRSRLDPHNQRICRSETGNHSEFIMPGYVPPREIAANGLISRVAVEQHWMKSDFFPERRTFWICYPPGYMPEKKYVVAYFNDGDGYLNFADLPRIMDYIIETRQVKPFIAVLLKPNDREKEYVFSSAYEQFVVNELVPWIDDVYPTIRHRSARVILGESVGALAATYLAYRQPEIFGGVVGQSGDYGRCNEWIFKEYASANNLKLGFHFVTGHLASAGDGDPSDKSNMLATHRRFVGMLREKGYLVSYAEYAEGGQWNFWRAHIGEALRFFWGSRI